MALSKQARQVLIKKAAVLTYRARMNKTAAPTVNPQEVLKQFGGGGDLISRLRQFIINNPELASSLLGTGVGSLGGAGLGSMLGSTGAGAGLGAIGGGLLGQLLGGRLRTERDKAVSQFAQSKLDPALTSAFAAREAARTGGQIVGGAGGALAGGLGGLSAGLAGVNEIARRTVPVKPTSVEPGRDLPVMTNTQASKPNPKDFRKATQYYAAMKAWRDANTGMARNNHTALVDLSKRQTEWKDYKNKKQLHNSRLGKHGPRAAGLSGVLGALLGGYGGYKGLGSVAGDAANSYATGNLQSELSKYLSTLDQQGLEGLKPGVTDAFNRGMEEFAPGR